MKSAQMIFDTDCVLCSGMVHFILAHEANGNSITFINAWGDTGTAIAARHGMTPADLHNSFLVTVDEKPFMKSDAGIEIAARLERPWRWLTILRYVPVSLRDGVYTFIAMRRYKWFGRRERCCVPPPEAKDRFIE